MLKFSSTVLLQVVTSVLRIRMSPFLLLGLSCLFLCACQAGGIYHTVKPGQTLYRISRTYGVNEAYLARVNRVSDPSQLPIGTRLFVPGAQRVLRVQVVKTKSPGKTVTVPVKKRVFRKQPEVKKAKTAVSKPRVLKTKATQVKKLQWPLRGKIVRSFSKKAKAGGGKGIEIAIRSGSDVTAAEAGKVIYSGDGVNGYAFLVILQHENDLFTVYGFNRKNLVRQGDFVSQGERIALSGTPPAGGQPRLHFEVRKGKIAVNPILYLP
ncbi:MAG: M23 family metallopeptidase [Pseudomonadota bacterium]|nr:M23 family metallopeptidase [Pseudomonadota bacterium]